MTLFTNSRIVLLLLGLSQLRLALAGNQTRYIDDTLGDSANSKNKPSYTSNPSDAWYDMDDLADCKDDGCIQYSKQDSFNGTIHAATYGADSKNSLNIDFKFTGTAIKIFFALMDKTTDTDNTGYDTVCDFRIDGVKVGDTFDRKPDLTKTGVQYKQKVFEKDGLDQKEHTFSIVTENQSRKNIVVVFDYAEYTYNDGNNTSSSSTTSSASPTSSAQNDSTAGGKKVVGNLSAPALVGISLGAFCAVVFLANVFCYIKRRNIKKAEQKGNKTNLSQFMPTSFGGGRGGQYHQLGGDTEANRMVHEPTTMGYGGVMPSAEYHNPYAR